ncbi:hypothetical protein AAE478_004224 [Parahypoxylon ruwenzoriense]
MGLLRRMSSQVMISACITIIMVRPPSDTGRTERESLMMEAPGLNSSTTTSAAITDGDGVAATHNTVINQPSTSFLPPYPLGTTAEFVAKTPLNSQQLFLKEAQEYLDIFRDQMLPSFAFIHLPPNVTAQRLHQERPFLLRAILAVVSPSKQQKLERGRELKQTLAQAALIENQSNIDLLLGLLTFIAWSQDQFLNKSGTLSRLMLLAMSLACDLRLNKPLATDAHMLKPIVYGSYGDIRSDDPNHTPFIEEQRAIDPMNWTPQMDKCLHTIKDNKEECPTDEGFAFQVELQLLAQKAFQVRESWQVDSRKVGIEATPSLAVILYLKTLQSQLDQLRNSLSPALQKKVRSDASRAPASRPESSENNGNSSGVLSLERLELLWRSVRAIKSWIDIYISMTPSDCAGFSFIHMAQMARCLVNLYRLSTYANLAWDCQAVRNTVDLLLALERIAEKLESISKEVGEKSNDDLFMQLSGMLRKFRAVASAKMTPNPAETGGAGWLYNNETTGNSDTTIQNQTTFQGVEFENDVLLENVFWGVFNG